MSSDDTAALARDITRLTASLENMHQIFTEFRGDLRRCLQYQNDLDRKLITVEQSQKDLKDNLDILVKLVRDGNGQPSLLQRVAQLETTQVGQDREIVGLKTHYDAQATARVLSKGQIWAGLAGMTITALLALGAILAQLMRP